MTEFPLSPLEDRYVKVVFNHPLREEFTYLTPPSWSEPPPIGSRILAQFGGRPHQIGFVSAHSSTAEIEASRIREIESCLDETPVITEGLMKLLRWISEYYYCSLGEAMFAAFPYGSRTDVRREKMLIPGPNWRSLLDNPGLPEKRRKVLSCFAESAKGFTAAELRCFAGVSQSVIDSLLKAEGLSIAFKPSIARVSEAESLYQSPRPELNPEQIHALSQVSEAIAIGKYKQFLLHGVTGSGKTEVFLHAIEETLKAGRTALVLVPEIALTPQTSARYRGRFPGQVEVLHSALSQAKRFEAWQKARLGEIPIIVGTRSAIFAPLPNLGLIVVDEEHDPSYKQADPAPRYHARDVSIYRGMLENAVVLLGSATPSLESYENVPRGKSTLIAMRHRATAHPLPTVSLVDMRQRPPTERVLASPTREAIQETLDLGLQTILFLNRRGHSTQLECRECGKALECPNCSVTLVWHTLDRSLKCHHCGYQQSEPEKCPGCQSNWIRARGYGTEQALEVIETAFPRARSERIDLDATQEQGAHDRILSRLRKGEIDILVGTQMVSKGLDMPGVRLVVVVQAETALNVADFRSAERSFALLTQVAGRAGRGEHPGKVLIQSYVPGHYSILTAMRHDYHGFRQIENRFRGQLGLPPHTRLMNIRAEGEENERVEEAIKEVASAFGEAMAPLRARGCRMIGPTPCPLEKLQGRFRWQLLVATRDGRDRMEILEHELVRQKLLKPPSKVRVIVDVDPMNVL